MPNDKHLFEAFPPVSAEQWVQQAVRDLKGRDFAGTLQYTTPDGITVHPFYTAEDLAGRAECRPLFTHTGWEISEAIRVKDESEANRQALSALNNGATGLILYLDAGARLDVLFREIQIPYIGIHFIVAGDLRAFHRNLNGFIAAQGTQAGKPDISVNGDFIASLMQKGAWKHSREEDISEWKELFTATAPFRTLCVDGAVYHNAGAPPAWQLACILAHMHEYICLTGTGEGRDGARTEGAEEDKAGTKDMIEGEVKGDAKNRAARIQVNIAVGPDYFFEIAKLRALRKISGQLLEAYGMDRGIRIHAETACRNLTLYDPYNNLLRTTTSAMAAVIGGCDSLTVMPFDLPSGGTTPFAGRMARNIQLILKEESHFDKVSDISAGSYFIETITEELASRAWSLFTEIEKSGGLISCLLQSTVQETIARFAREEQERFEQGREILVGVNKFPNPSETLKEKRVPQPQESTLSGSVIAPLETGRLAARQELARMKSETQEL